MLRVQAIERLAQLIGLNEEPPAPPGEPTGKSAVCSCFASQQAGWLGRFCMLLHGRHACLLACKLICCLTCCLLHASGTQTSLPSYLPRHILPCIFIPVAECPSDGEHREGQLRPPYSNRAFG